MEKAKFPMPTMNITQGYNEGGHKGAFALDLAGEDTGIDWVLAPFTGTIKKILSGTYGNWYWFESNEEVLCANGEVTKLVAMFGHDNRIRHKVGDIIRQGENLCAEGSSGNATGNHCHLEIGIGSYVGTWYKNSYGIYMLYNAVKPNEYLCLPDNYKIIKNGGYSWKLASEVKEPSASLELDGIEKENLEKVRINMDFLGLDLSKYKGVKVDKEVEEKVSNELKEEIIKLTKYFD